MTSNNISLLSAEESINGNEPSGDSGSGALLPVDSKELGALQDRFAIIPIHTIHNEYALTGEYMIDPNTGNGGIKLDNGKFAMPADDGRLKYHIMQFEQELGYYGMRNAIIKKAIYDDDSYVHMYKSGTNMLDDPIYIDDQKKIKKLCISIDLDITQSVDGTPRMQAANIDPDVILKYSVDMGERKEYTTKLSLLRMTIEEMDTISLAINEIILPSDLGCVLEDCRILVHSILIGIVEEEI